MRRHIALTILLLTILCCSCQHTSKRAWTGTGQPGVEKIGVAISGWVEHPGLYYLDSNASLESALSVFGEFLGVGMDGKPPSRVTLRRRTGETAERVHYDFRNMSKSQREAVRLRDGDELDFTLNVY